MEKWNAEDALEGETPEDILKSVNKQVAEIEAARKEIEQIPKSDRLKEILVKFEEIRKGLRKVGAYYGLKFAEKTDNTDILARLAQLSQLEADISSRTIFLDIWFMGLGPEKQAEYIEGVGEYGYYLEKIKNLAPYTMSEEVEQVLSIKSITSGSALSNIYEIFTNDFLYEFQGKKDVSQEEVMSNVHSPNPELREEAYKTVLSRYGENSVVLAEIYRSIALDWHNESVKIRRFPSSISMRNSSNDVKDEHVDALMKVVRRNAGLFTEYFRLKHKILGGCPYSRYHLYAPYTGVEKEYPYEECKKIVLEAYKEFDERFYTAAMGIFEKKHVHSHPAPKKRSGAFCMGITARQVPYILLNHTDKLSDLFTMMHEFGHGIHDVLARGQVDLLYSTSLPMAETASVFGEMLLASKMLEESEDEEVKKALLIDLLDKQYGTIIRQIYFTLFEQEAHQMALDGASKEKIEEKYIELLEEQFGEMEIPGVFRHEWNYIPHIHHTPFYCYAYSWGNLLVLSFYAMYKEQGQEFVDKYVELLSQGGGKAPEDLMKDMGVDPASEEFWQKGFEIIKEEIEELKRLAEI